MMYILYEMNVHSEIDRSSNEQDIINTIGEFFNENPGYRFMIVKYDDITTEPSWRSIRNIGDYEKYLQEYNVRKLQSKTCMQLKKEILDLSGTETPKMKKFTK